MERTVTPSSVHCLTGCVLGGPGREAVRFGVVIVEQDFMVLDHDDIRLGVILFDGGERQIRSENAGRVGRHSQLTSERSTPINW